MKNRAIRGGGAKGGGVSSYSTGQDESKKKTDAVDCNLCVVERFDVSRRRLNKLGGVRDLEEQAKSRSQCRGYAVKEGRETYAPYLLKNLAAIDLSRAKRG